MYKMADIDLHFQKVKITIEKGSGYIVRAISVIKGVDTVLEHFVTPNDPEARLASLGLGLDFISVDELQPAALPYTSYAEERRDEALEGRIRSTDSCFNFLWERPFCRVGVAKAKKILIGKWSDGETVLELHPGGGVNAKLSEGLDSPLSGLRNRGEINWWDFSMWNLSLGNIDLGGARYPILLCDEKTLVLSEKGIVRTWVFQRTQ